MERHIVALSGGKDSTALALLLNEREPRDYEYVCTPTGNELPAMEEHWATLERLLGKSLIRLTAQHTLMGLIWKMGMIPNHRARFCTRILKIEPFQAYALDAVNEGADVTLYVGLRADERTDDNYRAGAVYGIESINQRWPLAEWGMGLTDVKRYLQDRGIHIPKRTDCAWCFFQTLPEWFILWRDHQETFDQAVLIEETIGHTFRSDQRDTWPAALKDLGDLFESGHRPRNMRKHVEKEDAVQGLLDGFMDTRKEMCRACSL